MSDQHFADIDRWLAEALEAGALSFGELVARLPGVEPSVVRDRLARKPPTAEQVVWTRYARGKLPDARLPVPHPLDYDWRFDDSTADRLCERIVGSTHRVALLGTPSLWLRLRAEFHSRDLRLIDANQRILESAPERFREQVEVIDLLQDPIPQLPAADLVVADPPWYPDAIASFLWAASRICRIGGTVWLTAPGFGTRPGVSEEREELVGYATTLGLFQQQLLQGSLRYSAPPFERAALRKSGLLDYVPNEWRQGDLFIFSQTSHPVAMRPAAQSVRWSERSFGGVRIRFNDCAQPSGSDPRLVPLAEDDILPSVSRRHPLRDAVRVWTSGNRVFGCDAPRLLLAAVDAVYAGYTPDDPRAREAVASVRTLVDLERAEYIEQA